LKYLFGIYWDIRGQELSFLNSFPKELGSLPEVKKMWAFIIGKYNFSPQLYLLKGVHLRKAKSNTELGVKAD
jgi:hypothetical protein